MHQHQHAGRFAQVVDARDGLLAAVAALVQVHGACRSSPPRGGSCARRCPRPAGAAARPPGAPRRPIPRPGAPRPPASRSSHSSLAARGTTRSSPDLARRLPASAARTRRPPAAPPSTVRAVRRRPAPRARPAPPARGPSSDSTASRPRSAATSDQNTILLQVGQQRLTAPGLGVQIRDAAQLGLDPVILDAALAVEAEILGDCAVGQLADVLAGDRVQPASPVGSRSA